MAAGSPDLATDSRRLKRFLLAKEFAEVFQSKQFQAIPFRRLTQAYQSKHKKNFSPRQLGFSRNLENFVDELPIFSRVGGDRVTLSRAKLLEFFLRPVLKQCEGSTGPAAQRIPAITRAFKSYTGVKIESICEVLHVNSVEELLSEFTSDQDRQTNVQGAAFHAATGEKKEHVHGHTDERRAESESLQEEGSVIQNSRKRGCRVESESLHEEGSVIQNRKRGQAKTVEGGASPTDRDLPRMDVDEYPFLSRPTRVLLPHPQRHPIHSVSPTPAHVPRPPPPQSYPSRTHPQQAFPSNIRVQNITSGRLPIDAVPPTQRFTDSRHLCEGMISPPHPHRDQEREGVRLVSHQQSRGAPMHIPGPPSDNLLAEYLPLSPGPRSTPGRVTPGSSPSLSPGPQAHVAIPQVISSRRVSPIVGHPSPFSRYQPPTTSELVPKFPHPNLALGKETILPSHSAFRPDLQIPRTPPGATELSSSRRKRGTVDTKQKAIEKINTKVEELTSDLSSQGKFLQPDMVRRLVVEIISKENRGRQDRIVLRDITAMLDYSKVHGRIEELIKVFCWFSPVTSLHELEQAIIESEKVDNYETLHLGPITKHPKVIDLFKLQEAASLDSVPDISAYKIQNYLMKFLSKRKRSGKQSLEEFLEYVREREFAESVYHLCIRITSFPLAIQVGEIVMLTHRCIH